MKNKKTLIDINVPNNLNIMADNGEGVLFDFIEKIEKDTELKFNKKSYNYPENNKSLEGLSILSISNMRFFFSSLIYLSYDDIEFLAYCFLYA